MQCNDACYNQKSFKPMPLTFTLYTDSHKQNSDNMSDMVHSVNECIAKVATLIPNCTVDADDVDKVSNGISSCTIYLRKPMPLTFRLYTDSQKQNSDNKSDMVHSLPR